MTDTPQDAPALDLDAWLDDLELPTDTVTIYNRPSLVAEYQRVQSDLVAAQRAARDDDDDTERAVGEESPVAELTQRRDRLRTKLEASGHKFRLHGLSQEAHQGLIERHRDKQTGQLDLNGYIAACLAATADIPEEKVAALRSRLHVAEWTKLTDRVQALLNGTTDLPL
jgi:hypothetical protein